MQLLHASCQSPLAPDIGRLQPVLQFHNIMAAAADLAESNSLAKDHCVHVHTVFVPHMCHDTPSQHQKLDTRHVAFVLAKVVLANNSLYQQVPLVFIHH